MVSFKPIPGRPLGARHEGIGLSFVICLFLYVKLLLKERLKIANYTTCPTIGVVCFFSVTGILYNFMALTNKEGLNMVLRAWWATLTVDIGLFYLTERIRYYLESRVFFYFLSLEGYENIWSWKKSRQFYHTSFQLEWNLSFLSLQLTLILFPPHIGSSEVPARQRPSEQQQGEKKQDNLRWDFFI